MIRPIALLLVITSLWFPANGVQAEWQVWTTTQTRRVLREEPAGSALAVELSAARNEWQSFQILLNADEPIGGITVVPGDLVGPEGAVLRASDGGLYRQHQFHIQKGSLRNGAFIPGWYPDGLIPFLHPLTGKPLQGARLQAVPFDLPPYQTHGFWADIYVPAGAKPGLYRGTYRITAAGGKAVEIPVSFTVWDFELPAFPTMKTNFGGPARHIRRYYRARAAEGKDTDVADVQALELQCAKMLSELHISAMPNQRIEPTAGRDGSFYFSDAEIRAWREALDEYHPSALWVVHPNTVIKDPERQRSKLQAWLAAFDEAAKKLNRPQVLFYTYLVDEPGDLAAFEMVRKWGRVIREAKSAVKVMVTTHPVAHPEWGNLFGAVDIWCTSFAEFSQAAAEKRQALGETIWIYTCLCTGDKKSPWWQTDFPLLHYRVPAWIMWHYRIRGLLYWGGASHWDAVEDPWTDPQTHRVGDLVFNGEGSMTYPGRAVGYEGLAPSLRLKAIRDSIEDYEYLAILERLGLDAEAEKVVTPLAGSFHQWDPDPAAYETARAKLAQMIIAATRPQ